MMFSQHDLAWLDDILPDKDKKKKEDDKKKKKVAEAESDEEVRKMDRDRHARTAACVYSVYIQTCVTPSGLGLSDCFLVLILYVSPLCPTVLLKWHCSTLTTVFSCLSLTCFNSRCLIRPPINPVV